MEDHVVYHKPEAMGYPATQVQTLSVVTNKRVKKAMGDRVWLLTGEGLPRKYYLRLYFTVESIDSTGGPKFHTRLSGTSGRFFDPMVELDGEEWLPELKHVTGNFSFGFSTIKSTRITDGLERAAERSARAATPN